MASVNSIIAALAPDLATDANKNTFVEIATERTSQAFFCDNYNLAIALRACHMWALSQYRIHGEAGAISEKKEGQLSMGFQNTGKVSGAGDLDQTHFGKQLKALIRSSDAGITVLGAGTTLSC